MICPRIFGLQASRSSCVNSRIITPKQPFLKIGLRMTYQACGRHFFSGLHAKASIKNRDNRMEVDESKSSAPSSSSNPRSEYSSISIGRPSISKGEDEKAVLVELESLLASGWILDDSAIGVEKAFLFKSWTKCLDFVNRIGLQSKVKNHHPTITLTYGKVKIHWTTHQPAGLSQKDTQMAVYCNEQADKIGSSAKKAKSHE